MSNNNKKCLRVSYHEIPLICSLLAVQPRCGGVHEASGRVPGLELAHDSGLGLFSGALPAVLLLLGHINGDPNIPIPGRLDPDGGAVLPSQHLPREIRRLLSRTRRVRASGQPGSAETAALRILLVFIRWYVEVSVLQPQHGWVVMLVVAALW